MKVCNLSLKYITRLPLHSMPAGLCCVSQYFPFPCSTHLAYSVTICNETVYWFPSMTLAPSSTVLWGSEHIARGLRLKRGGTLYKIYIYIYTNVPPFLTWVSRRAHCGRRSSFGNQTGAVHRIECPDVLSATGGPLSGTKRVRFTESRTIFIISFILVVLFTQFIVDK
jgi:hypothetical protein